jgi:oligopeptide/dipeptide ABC transporter ATP-binding protein
MYAGRIVETAPARSIIESAAHPYSRALINCIPRSNSAGKHSAKLPVISGSPPRLYAPLKSCPFFPRCPKADETCAKMPAVTDIGNGRSVCCHHPEGNLGFQPRWQIPGDAEC